MEPLLDRMFPSKRMAYGERQAIVLLPLADFGVGGHELRDQVQGEEEAGQREDLTVRRRWLKLTHASTTVMKPFKLD